MESPAAVVPAKLTPAANQEEAIRHLDETARAAFEKFRATGDVAALDPVLLAIIDDFIPRPPASPLAVLPGTTRLVEDLEFDSLAITEVVFFTEDLFDIRIANEEIVQLRTLDDLRGFVRSKVSGRTAA